MNELEATINWLKHHYVKKQRHSSLLEKIFFGLFDWRDFTKGGFIAINYYVARKTGYVGCLLLLFNLAEIWHCLNHEKEPKPSSIRIKSFNGRLIS